MRDALLFVTFMWAAIFLILGMGMSLGLVLWPFSDRPLWCFEVGVGGVAISVISAWVMLWTERGSVER